MTRGEILRHAIAFALRPARYAVADHVVSQLKERGDPWDLNAEARAGPAHSTPDMTPR
jgi:hypothetical protein